MLTVLVVIVTCLTLYLYLYLRKKFSHWKDRNVVGPTPQFVVGNLLPNFLRQKSIGQLVVDAYNKYQGYAAVGFYQTFNPQLIIRDPELIKNITVKDFKCFQNNEFFVDKEVDPIFGRNPFVLNDDEWKASRAQLTPCFTNSKIKNLVPLIETNCKKLLNHIKTNPNATNSTGLEAKFLCTKFTLDNVAACAFGIDGKSFEDDNSEFRQIAYDFVERDTLTTLKFLILMVLPFPFIINLLKIKFLKQKTEEQIQKVVKETVEYRERNKVERNDFLSMLTKMRNEDPDKMSYLDLSAHAASFIFDGFETSSNVMSYVLHHLAHNQSAQERVREEIKEFKRQNNGVITYEALRDMKYLDACFNESLRLTPPILILTKVCNEDYEYTPSNTEEFGGDKVKIEAGTSVVLPVGGLAWDPKYFEDPLEYRPERFLKSEESRHENFNYIFFPFGVGRRACLGQTFGILQLKLGLVAIIEHFRIKPNPKTKVPLEFDTWYFLHATKDGLWLNFEQL